ncbi:kelch-like protein 24 [Diadema antillarum]|uniref:kelch-like protein 24 n=1 Tax=Diadema antillarum TaxID=105358 RepID=UPI003A83CC26
MDELLDAQEKRDFCDYEDCVWIEGLSSTFQSMRQAGELTDFMLCAEDNRFPCHKMLLAAGSPYFKAMFTGPMRVEDSSSSADLQDISSTTAELLLDYMYTGRLKITADNVQELLIAANFLLLERLVEACCDFLRRQLDQHNCFEMLSFADAHGCMDLKRAAQRYILKNFMETSASSAFLEATYEQLLSFLGHDDLSVTSEKELGRKVLGWVGHNPGTRKAQLPSLLRLVRLPYLPIETLRILLNDSLISTCRECQDIVKTAMYCKTDVLPRIPEWKSPRRSTNQAECLVVLGGVQSSQLRNSSSLLQFCCDPRAPPLTWVQQTIMPYMLRNTVMYDVACFQNALYVSGGFDGERGTLGQVWRYRYHAEEPGQSETWERVSSLQVARYQHGSAVTRGKLFVVGGYNGLQALAEVESYSTDTNAWTPCPPMPEPVTFPAAVGYKERLYVMGGMKANSGVYPWTQCFNLATESWSIIKTLELKSKGGKSVLLNDAIYIVGGPSRDVHVYDPESDAAFDVSPTHEFHVCAGVTVNGGKIYVAGGDNLKDRRNWDSIECYDPANDTWTTVGRMPLPLYWHGLATVVRDIHGLRPLELPDLQCLGPSMLFRGFGEGPADFDPR